MKPNYFYPNSNIYPYIIFCRLPNSETRMVVTPGSPHLPATENAICSIMSSLKLMARLEVSHSRALSLPRGVTISSSTIAFSKCGIGPWRDACTMASWIIAFQCSSMASVSRFIGGKGSHAQRDHGPTRCILICNNALVVMTISR